MAARLSIQLDLRHRNARARFVFTRGRTSAPCPLQCGRAPAGRVGSGARPKAAARRSPRERRSPRSACASVLVSFTAFDQCRARPVALRRHLPVRHRRAWRDVAGRSRLPVTLPISTMPCRWRSTSVSAASAVGCCLNLSADPHLYFVTSTRSTLASQVHVGSLDQALDDGASPAISASTEPSDDCAPAAQSQRRRWLPSSSGNRRPERPLIAKRTVLSIMPSLERATQWRIMT